MSALLFGVGAMILACVAQAQERTAARVVYVTDGDTVDVLEAGGVRATVRLAGIDAPEKSQPFGPESQRNLATLVAGRDINLECTGAASYGREVCKILIGASDDVDLDQVRARDGVALQAVRRSAVVSRSRCIRGSRGQRSLGASRIVVAAAS